MNTDEITFSTIFITDITHTPSHTYKSETNAVHLYCYVGILEKQKRIERINNTLTCFFFFQNDFILIQNLLTNNLNYL